METFAERLAEVRRLKLMTQEELANAAGVSAATVTRLETVVDTLPRVATVKRLAKALGVDPAWLLWGEEEPALMGKLAA
jgi:transcriptional regulator with XRE-family HTH domain